MRWDTKDIGQLSNLLVKIIVIGYQKKGESCIFLLIDRRDQQIIYSIVIDSYKRRKQNRTLELLRHFGVKEESLNILCWSHPDEDHSLGIDEIWKKYAGKNTIIITPISFWSRDYNIKAFNPNKREVDFLEYVTGLNSRTHSTLLPESTAGGGDLVWQINFSAGVDTIKFRVWILSPLVGRLKGLVDSNGSITRNQTSVTLVVELGDNQFVFPADLPNEEIALLNEEAIENPLFLKIPHHGSVSSAKFLDYIPVNPIAQRKANILACTTIFHSTKDGSQLPQREVIERYIDKCSKVCNTGSDKKENFGAVIAEYDLFGQEECIISTEGSAFEYKDNAVAVGLPPTAFPDCKTINP